jgi:chromosome partitioning protein
MQSEVDGPVYGLDDPAEYFDRKNDEGNEAIALRRWKNRKNNQVEDRPEKTFKAIEASILIGRSKQWLRDNDPDAPKDDNGHAHWTIGRINELRETAGTRLKRPEGVEPLVLPFCKLKGGVGNTTACAHFAHYLAMHGLKVLAVDLDSQSTLTSTLAGLNPDIHFDDEDVPVHALENEPGEFQDVIRETYFPNVYLAPSNGLLRNLEVELTLQTFGHKPSPVDEDGNPIHANERLAYGLESVKEHFDVILIDCPPNLNVITMNALHAADGMINVLRPNGPDTASYAMFLGSLANYYHYAPRSLRYYRILVSQYQNNGGCNDEDLLLRQTFGHYVLHNKIHVNAEIGRSLGQLHTVYSLYKPVSTREAHKNGKDTMNKACGEMLSDIKAIWDMEAEIDG